MERSNRRQWPSWKNLKQRISWKRISISGFCGSSKWVLETNTGEEPLMTTGDQSPASNGTTMNLATALAADRLQMNMGPTDGMMTTKPLKSIVRLFEVDDQNVKAAEYGGGVVGARCCLCTDRYKGAALVPCGHTYCRVCCRAMWSKKESCPVCSRSITEILEIF